MTRQEIKQRAKEQLGNNLFGNNWLIAVLVCFINSIIMSALASTVIGTIIVSGPLTFGLCALFVKQSRDGQTMAVEGLFDGFTKDFVGTFLLGLISSILVFLWSLLFVIPGIIKSYAYSMAFYIKSDHPEYDWKACIDESQKMMQGHKMDLFVLDLSFIGWYLLGALICGIGTLWVIPYHSASRAQFYENLKANIVF